MSEIVGAFLPLLPEYSNYATSLIDALGINDKTLTVKESLKDELSEASVKDKIIVAIAALAATGEWGPFNELIAAIPSLAILENTGNPVAAGVVGGVIYAAEQGIFGLATAGAIKTIPKTEEIARNEFNTASKEGASKLDRALLLFGMGTSAAILNEHARNKEQTFKKDVKLLGKMTVLLSAIDIAIFTAANEIIDNSDKVNIDSNTVIDIATNPWTYIAAFGLIKFTGVYNKYRKNANNPINQLPTQE